MLRPMLIGGNKRKIDVRLHGGGELALRFFRAFLQTLQGHPILAQINALVLLELIR